MKHFDNISVVKGDIHIDVRLDRFEEQFQDAQYWLDTNVMTDMIPFMPMQTGTLINLTRAMSAAVAGTGQVYAAAPPYGRFQYMGKVMIDPETGSPWARKNAEKIVTKKPLTYNKAAHPLATSHWFNAAKSAHGKKWVDTVKKIGGGGKP